MMSRFVPVLSWVIYFWSPYIQRLTVTYGEKSGTKRRQKGDKARTKRVVSWTESVRY